MAARSPERMRLAAAKQRSKVLDSENRRLDRRDLYGLLRSADIVVPSDVSGFSEERLEILRKEAEAFQLALKEVGVRTTPRLRDSLDQALTKGHALDVTLKLDDAQFDAVRDDLREAVLALTVWSPGAEPAEVFDGSAARAGKKSRPTVAEAADGLCLICVPRERLSEERRARTFEVVHLLAPRLSPERLDALERCLGQVESGRDPEEASRPGLTGPGRVGVIPVWPDPEGRRKRWAAVADRSWVFAAPVGSATDSDAELVVRRMAPCWERASLPGNGAALGSVLVEVAIQSAARRAQALGRAAEEAFGLRDECGIRDALDGLAADLAELNTGVNELELAAADARADLERTLDSLPDRGEDEEVYESLRDALDDSLDKLDRQQQRLQGSFLAAREHAANFHVAKTVDALRVNQEAIAKTQGDTEELNRVVSRLTVLLLGPTIAFGALGVTDYWFPRGDYLASLAVLFGYVLVGFGVSLLIWSRIDWIDRLLALGGPRATSAELARTGDTDPVSTHISHS